MMKFYTLFFTLFLIISINSCGGGGSGGVTVSWTANKEVAVNTTGGGYIVYYSTSSGFDTSSASSVDVPYVSGNEAPTSTTLSLSNGTWYFKVVAYSASFGSTIYSQPSSEFSLVVN